MDIERVRETLAIIPSTLVTLVLFGCLALSFLAAIGLTLSWILLLFCILIISWVLLSHDDIDNKKLRIRSLSTKKLIIATWAACILFVLVVPRNPDLVIDWFNVNGLELLGGLSSLGLCTFFVGYGVISLLGFEKKIDPLETVLYSVILSMLMTGLLGFVAECVGSFATLGPTLVIAVSEALLVALIVVWQRGCNTEAPYVEFRPKLIILCVSFAVLVMGCFALVNYPLQLVPVVDQWFHFGSALDTKNDALFTSYPSYYWNSLFDGMVISLSPLPSVNTYLLLLPLGLISIPAFYATAKRLLGVQQARWSVIVFSLFSGLAGVVGIGQQLIFNESTYTASLRASLLTLDGVSGSLSFPLFYFPKSIGIACMLLCISLLLSKPRLSRNERIVLYSLTLILGYLWHMAEAIFLLIMMPILVLSVFRTREQRETVALGSVIAVLVVGIIDVLAPYSVYNLDVSRTPSLLVSVVVIGAVSALVIIAILGRRLNLRTKWNNVFWKHLTRVVAFLLILALSIEILVWCFALFEINASRYQGTVPPFMYPAKLGLGVIIALLVVYKTDSNNCSNKILIPSILGVLAFALARSSTWIYYNFSVLLFWENRLVDYLWPWVAMLAGVGIAQIAKRAGSAKLDGTNRYKQPLLVLLLLTLLLVGSSSKPYEVEVRSQPAWTLTIEEVNELGNLHDISGEYSVMAGDIHINAIRAFTSATTLDTYSQYILQSQNALEAFVVLSYNTHTEELDAYPRYYVEIDRYSGVLERFEDRYFLSHLRDFIPLISNSSIDIYEIPDFAPPSSDPAVLVCVPDDTNGMDVSLNLLLEMLAMANESYNVASNSSIRISDNTKVVISADLSLSITLDDWIRAGGRFIHVNMSVLDATVQGVREYDRIGNQTHMVPMRGWVPENGTASAGTNVLLWYNNMETNLYPLLSFNHRGNGDSMSLNLWPLFNSILSQAEHDCGRRLWRTLPTVWSVLGLGGMAPPVKGGIGLAVAQEFVELNGQVIIDCQSIIPKEVFDIDYIYENGSVAWSSELRGIYSVGNTIFRLVGDSITLSPSGTLDGIRATSPQPVSIQFELSSSDNLVLVLENESRRLGEGAHQIRINSHNETQTLELREPEVECVGITHFRKIYAAWPFGVYFPETELTVVGVTNFTVIASGHGLGMTNLSIIGTTVIGTDTAQTYEALAYDTAFKNAAFIPTAILVTSILILLALPTKQLFGTAKRYIMRYSD